MSDASYIKELESKGFCIRRAVVAPAALEEIGRSVDEARGTAGSRFHAGELFGMRNLLLAVPSVRGLASSKALRQIVAPVLGEHAVAVRGLYFDKTAKANWRLGWHQDRAIAVAERASIRGYGPWSIKAGVPHVFPPNSVLAGMLTVRLHLDPCSAAGGALCVLPGTHRGRVDEAECERLEEAGYAVSCDVGAGDAVVMRPLLAHRSEKTHQPQHRRVIHLEYAGVALPPPLEWFESVRMEA